MALFSKLKQRASYRLVVPCARALWLFIFLQLSDEILGLGLGEQNSCKARETRTQSDGAVFSGHFFWPSLRSAGSKRRAVLYFCWQRQDSQSAAATRVGAASARSPRVSGKHHPRAVDAPQQKTQPQRE